MLLDKKQLKELVKSIKKDDGTAAAKLCSHYRIAAYNAVGYKEYVKCIEMAILYGKKSAEKNNSQGIVELAKCLELIRFDGSDKLKQLANKSDDLFKKIPDWLKLAAKAKNVEAQYYLGMSYFKVPFGHSSFNKDNEAAIMWLKNAADQGHILAAYFLGMRYARGLGVEQNNELAAKFLSIAAQKGHGLSAVYCCILYPNAFSSDSNKLIDHLMKIAKDYLNELSKEKYQIPSMSIFKRIQDETAAKMCSPRLLYEAGCREFFGTNDCPRNETAGLENIKYAAECGHIDAENTYGCILLTNNPEKNAIIKALQYFADAGEQKIWTAECGGGCFEWKSIILRLVYDLNFFPAY